MLQTMFNSFISDEYKEAYNKFQTALNTFRAAIEEEQENMGAIDIYDYINSSDDHFISSSLEDIALSLDNIEDEIIDFNDGYARLVDNIADNIDSQQHDELYYFNLAWQDL